jgi:hypothetical protein
VPQTGIDDGSVLARTILVPLESSARAEMSELSHGFIKLFCQLATGMVIGGPP